MRLCSSRTSARCPTAAKGEFKRIWFKVVYVFDISQIDGTPLPELPTKSTGERGDDMLVRLLRFADSRGITVRFVEQCCLNGAAGTSRGKEIEIRTAETDIPTQAATLAHEIAHSLLHWTEGGHKITTRDGKEIDKRQRELEAEATAYVVSNYFYGLTAIPFGRYVVASAAGMAPLTLLYVSLGAAAREVVGDPSGPAGAWKWTLIVVGVVVTLAATLYARTIVKRAVEEGAERPLR